MHIKLSTKKYFINKNIKRLYIIFKFKYNYSVKTPSNLINIHYYLLIVGKERYIIIVIMHM